LFLLLSGLDIVAAEIPGLVLTPVPIATPRTVNPYRVGPGSSGKTWFTDVNFKQVGFLSSDGAITAFRLIDADPSNEVRPLAITEGPDGNGWFTISLTNGSGVPLRTEIGRVTPDGVVTRFPTPTTDACRVFGSAPVCGITVGPDGNLWFTQTQAKRIGKITLSGEITEYFADGAGGEFFYEITAGPDGNLWVADSSASIIRVTPSGVIAFFDRQNMVPVGITSGPDGNVWFTDPGSHSIGRITPEGVITLLPTPSASSFPRSIVTAADGKIYFTENAAAAPKIGRLDPTTLEIQESSVSGRGQLRDLVVPLDSLRPGFRISDTQFTELNMQSSDGTAEFLTRVTVAMECPPIGIQPATVPAATEEVDYLVFLSATGANCPCRYFVQGQPPPGMRIDSDGAVVRLLGRPVVEGMYRFTLGVRDRDGCVGSRDYTVEVRPAAPVDYSPVKEIEEVNKVSGTNKANVGDVVSFTIVVDGSGNANFTLTDTLPAGLELISAAGSGDMTRSGSTVSWTSRGGGFYRIVARVTQEGPITNCARVQAERELNPGNDVSCATINPESPPKRRSVRH
jgi:uncharacterized repeat protein (TIGR01451 family)